MGSPIIVALDGMDISQAVEMAQRLRSKVFAFKVNDLLLERGAVHLIGMGPLFYDPKLHDIPNTVRNSARKIAGLPDVKIVTVHASGGTKMMKSAVEELPGKVAAVTVLTSLDESGCHHIYGEMLGLTVQRFVCMAESAGCEYLVCSGHELSLPTVESSALKTIVPGVRPEWYQAGQDDQARKMTPREAIDGGADLLVMGRPITKAADPLEALERTLGEIEKG